MSTITTPSLRAAIPIRGIVLAGLMLALAGAAALLAGWTPILFSIVTVFLFAGPHNWLEARYFLTRLPARWGKLRGFFLFAFGGIFALTALFASFPWIANSLQWGPNGWHTGVAVWNTLMIGWIAALVLWRSRQNPRRDWGLAVPVAFLLIALNWLFPLFISLGLVYLHPLMALLLLDRELKRTRPQWRPAYHICLVALPVLLGLLWWKLYNAPPLPGDSALREAITNHAGSGVLHGISSHLLVATHTFLEMVHYGVWLLAMPLVGIRMLPWKLANVPMARRSTVWRFAIIGLLLIGFAIMLVLWAFFLADYPTTRYVYFTVALLHVLAEVPFLLRAL